LEGKTTTAANIAMALAYGGSRVLLTDADMRRPGLHRPLRLTNERGLSQVLIGQARVRDVIQRTVDPNLLAITAGRTPPNPSELLSSERMKTLLTNLAHGPFDWIIIDMLMSERPRIGRGPGALLDWALIACLVVVAAQLIPLPAWLWTRLSPHAIDVESAVRLETVSPASHPLSLDPNATAWALALGA